MPPGIPFLLLHEIFPDPPAWVNLILFAGAIGVPAMPVLWLIRRPSVGRATRRQPPLKRLLLGSLVPMMVLGIVCTADEGRIDRELLVLWVVIWLWLAGLGTCFWWVMDRLRGQVVVTAPVLSEPDAPRSAEQTCEQCMAAAVNGGTQPLKRVAHNADGPRFLYRCAACHAFWEKDVSGMRPISVLRVRQEFPNAVI